MSILAVPSQHYHARATARILGIDQVVESISIVGMISMRVRLKVHIIVDWMLGANVYRAINADFTKDIWREAATADSWYKIKFTSEIAGTMDMTPLCFHLDVSLKKQISFTTKQQMAFLEWAWLKD